MFVSVVVVVIVAVIVVVVVSIVMVGVYVAVVVDTSCLNVSDARIRHAMLTKQGCTFSSLVLDLSHIVDMVKHICSM